MRLLRLLRLGVLAPLRVALVAVGLLAGTVVGGLPGAVATAADAPALAASPTSGMSGDSVELTGTACGTPGAALDLLFVQFSDQSGQSIGAIAGHVTLDGSGSFTTTVTVPWGVTDLDHPRYSVLVPPGHFEFVVLDRDALPPVCTTGFDVTDAVTLALSGSPTSGPAGSTVHVTFACFEPWQLSLDVHAEVDGAMVPGSTVHDIVDVGAAPDVPLAEFEGDVTLPADLADGTVVQLVGQCTGVDYTAATFVVASATSTTPPPAAAAASVASQAEFTG